MRDAARKETGFTRSGYANWSRGMLNTGPWRGRKWSFTSTGVVAPTNSRWPARHAHHARPVDGVAFTGRWSIAFRISVHVVPPVGRSHSRTGAYIAGSPGSDVVYGGMAVTMISARRVCTTLFAILSKIESYEDLTNSFTTVSLKILSG